MSSPLVLCVCFCVSLSFCVASCYDSCKKWAGLTRTYLRPTTITHYQQRIPRSSRRTDFLDDICPTWQVANLSSALSLHSLTSTHVRQAIPVNSERQQMWRLAVCICWHTHTQRHFEIFRSQQHLQTFRELPRWWQPTLASRRQQFVRLRASWSSMLIIDFLRLLLLQVHFRLPRRESSRQFPLLVWSPL